MSETATDQPLPHTAYFAQKAPIIPATEVPPLVDDTIRKEYIEAFIRLQAALTNPKMGGYNPHHKSKYAKLEDILDLVRPLLGEHGFMLTQHPNGRVRDGQVVLVIVTTLRHASGQYDRAYGEYSTNLETQKGSQAVVAATTYAKKNELCAFLGICGGHDDDGEFDQGPAANIGTKVKRKGAVSKDVAGARELATRETKQTISDLAGSLGLEGTKLTAMMQRVTGCRISRALYDTQAAELIVKLKGFPTSADAHAFLAEGA